MLLRRLSQAGMTIRPEDWRAMDEWEPAEFSMPLAQLQAYDVFHAWGHRLEQITDEDLLAYVAAIDLLRKQTDA